MTYEEAERQGWIILELFRDCACPIGTCTCPKAAKVWPAGNVVEVADKLKEVMDDAVASAGSIPTRYGEAVCLEEREDVLLGELETLMEGWAVLECIAHSATHDYGRLKGAWEQAHKSFSAACDALYEHRQLLAEVADSQLLKNWKTRLGRGMYLCWWLNGS